MVMQHMFFPPALKIKRQHTHNTQKRTHLFSSQSLVPCKNTTEYLFLSLQKYVYKYCKRYWNTDILLHVQLHIFLVQPVYGYRIWATSHTHGFYIKTAGFMWMPIPFEFCMFLRKHWIIVILCGEISRRPQRGAPQLCMSARTPTSLQWLHHHKPNNLVNDINFLKSHIHPYPMNIPLRSSKFSFIGLIPHEFDPAKIFITPRRRREARPRDARPQR